MGELAHAMGMMKKGFSTSILHYPSKRYGIVGSIPAELTKMSKGLFPQRVSQSWDTEQEVIDALLGIGITKFQCSDCSWYKA